MAIEQQTVGQVAALAKIELSEPQQAAMVKDLNAILSLVEAISVTNTTNIEPLAHPLDASQPMREDKSLTISNTAEIQSLSRHIEDKHYIVPKVID